MPADEGKRHNLGIRTTKELKGLLEGAAESGGRSVAQEIERRIQQTVDLDQIGLTLFIDLAAAYRSGQEWAVIHQLMARGGPDEEERWRRWHAMMSALLTYRANNPIKEYPPSGGEP